jgi:hypothetical protein
MLKVLDTSSPTHVRIPSFCILSFGTVGIDTVTHSSLAVVVDNRNFDLNPETDK